MANYPPVHKSIPRALLRWAVILGVCVLVSIVLRRVEARMRYHENMAREFAEDARFVAERHKAAGPNEQAWLGAHAAYNAKVRRQYEWASRYPWRSVPMGPVMNRPGD